MKATALLYTDGVTMDYGIQAALQEVSMEIRHGGFYGLLGPNGSGKTTLISVLSGAMKPTSGRVLWQDRDLSGYSRREIARSFAVVPQDYYINFPFSVTEIVMMGRKPHLNRFARSTGADLEVVYRCMEVCGIMEHAEKPITNLSGGERQRVILARALAQTPEVLFLDEATSNLDICHKIELMSLVKRMNVEQGLTVIAAMHDLSLAGIFCDELVYLERGKVVCSGPAEQVFNEEVISKVFKIKVQIQKNTCNGVYNLSLLPELA
ncbi:Hemin import ATP-binding protein HmuV [Pelotomaculum sp. FP]|uniref:ABC transporter ATP-binding protein n=1 Tax=Pelotomaculum sp. FP TaxID=261474 RepID=UPI0010658814|nr:ABC transporter ATP-binding protein [Pelotomaculum sp. FP]TEB17399.1 Hemin import ATP-binding protein HmuV [Pelotomaculum sp. FP]